MLPYLLSLQENIKKELEASLVSVKAEEERKVCVCVLVGVTGSESQLFIDLVSCLFGLQIFLSVNMYTSG